MLCLLFIVISRATVLFKRSSKVWFHSLALSYFLSGPAVFFFFLQCGEICEHVYSFARHDIRTCIKTYRHLKTVVAQ